MRIPLRNIIGWIKKASLKIGLIGFGFLAAFLILEIAVRIFVMPPTVFDIYEPVTQLAAFKPGAEGYWKKSCFETYIKINSLGWRDDEFTEGKSQGTFRTVVLGDSYVEALQVPLEATFHKILEEKMRDAGIKNEVLAIGKSGNGLFRDYLYLKNHGMRYKPDLVILMFTALNDIRDDSLDITRKYVAASGDFLAGSMDFPIFNDGKLERYELHAFQDRRLVVLKKYAKSLLKKSALFSFLYPKTVEALQKYRRARIMQNDSSVQNSNLGVDYEILLKQYDKMWENAWKTEKVIVENIKNLAEEIKAPFLIVSVPETLRVKQPEYLDEKIYDLNKPERLMKNIADMFHIPFLNLLPIFRKYFEETGEQLSFQCDGHWNETGHRLAAEAIYSFLQKQRLIGHKKN